jgi:hypothetical protein
MTFFFFFLYAHDVQPVTVNEVCHSLVRSLHVVMLAAPWWLHGGHSLVVTRWSFRGHSCRGVDHFVVTLWSLVGHSLVTPWALGGHSVGTRWSLVMVTPWALPVTPSRLYESVSSVQYSRCTWPGIIVAFCKRRSHEVYHKFHLCLCMTFEDETGNDREMRLSASAARG